MSDNGPWGSGNGSDNGSDSGPRNPWGQSASGKPADGGKRAGSNIEDLFKRGGSGGGGFSGGGLPRRANGKSFLPLIIIALVGFWIFSSSVHRIGPQEEGVVSLFGKYSSTLKPGLHFTAPSPIQTVQILDVKEIRTIDIPQGADEKLVLTGDENIIDLAYSVRWNIKDPKLFLFQLKGPEETIREVAESAMRAVVANFTLDDTIGADRTTIEQQVEVRMQELLDGYRAGVLVQGVAIKQADPPEAVNDAFKEVSAAKQTAETYLNEARAYAQQLTAQAQGEAAAFDKVYAQYRLAPRVTRQRMYYETMERVLGKVDKTVVETRGVTTYLPLPEIRKRAQAAPSAPAGGQ